MSVANNKGSIFTSVQKKRQSRSNFNLSHDVKLSLDMGKLIPAYVQECLPGDHMTISTSSMLRFAPLIAPVMHKIDVIQEYFFVPNRILWSNWETFITGSRNGKQLGVDDMPAFPTIRPYANEIATMYKTRSSLMDYLGLPPTDVFTNHGEQPPQSGTAVNALPFAAYQRIYDEYYRDENLQESMYDRVEDDDGATLFENYNQLPDGATANAALLTRELLTLRNRAWEHDYFTSALPWAQKGEAVRIPVDTQIGFVDSQNVVRDMAYRIDGSGPASADAISTNASGLNILEGGTRQGIGINNSANLTAEASGTINDLRAAIKLQEWLETNARGGSRYFESIYAHFGVKSPDSRLQRPEFIGSNRSNMIISEVLQTSSPQVEEDTPQANMSGHGQTVNNSKNFKYYCQEHGFIIGIISVIPKTAYMQGAEKHWWKTGDRLDYYFPEFAHLGEQEILNKEIYLGGGSAQANEVFGYTPRYAEYKFKNSRVAGDFRDSLKYWHLGRDFENRPALNADFINADVSKRIFAVGSLPDRGDGPRREINEFGSIYAHVFHDVKASRLMPKYGTPSI